MSKACTKCGETKPLADYYRDSRVKDRVKHKATCKTCVSMYNFNRAGKTRFQGKHKKCSRCKVTQEIALFYADKNAPDGCQNYCKACQKIDRAKRKGGETFVMCRWCDTEYPLTSAHWHSQRGEPTGFHLDRCRNCIGRRQIRRAGVPVDHYEKYFTSPRLGA